MSDKYPGFFTAIFGGRKAKEPEPVKPKEEQKTEVVETVKEKARSPESDPLSRFRERMRKREVVEDERE